MWVHAKGEIPTGLREHLGGCLDALQEGSRYLREYCAIEVLGYATYVMRYDIRVALNGVLRKHRQLLLQLSKGRQAGAHFLAGCFHALLIPQGASVLLRAFDRRYDFFRRRAWIGLGRWGARWRVGDVSVCGGI